jgi:hypothetical protein
MANQHVNPNEVLAIRFFLHEGGRSFAADIGEPRAADAKGSWPALKGLGS